MIPKPLCSSADTVDIFAKSFYTISRMHVGMCDIRRERCQATAGDGIHNLCSFCRTRCADFLEQCRQCDIQHVDKVVRSGQTLIYQCHLGLTEVLIPIVDDNTVTGVVFLGQVFISDQSQISFSRLSEYLTALYPNAFPKEEQAMLLHAYENTASVTKEQLDAYVNLAEIAVRGLYLNRWIRNRKYTTREYFLRYLEDNDLRHIPLSELSAQRTADQLNISYSQLNRLSSAVTGMPFKQYVLQVKLDAAAALLKTNPTKKIGDIAATVGFDDVHYFSRIFRRKTGKSCIEYRNST